MTQAPDDAGPVGAATAQSSRQDLIRAIEEQRGSRVLVYVTSDRQPASGNIGDDAVRPIIEHLRSIGSCDQLDVFIYSRGGAIDVPWRINTAIRGVAKRWSALVPFRANSAATLLCLGADEVVLGAQGELGPIDPIMSFSRPTPNGPAQESLSVEDIMAFPKFVKERFALDDEGARAGALSHLVGRLDAVILGNAYRTHSHIRFLAKNMLASRAEPLDADKVDAIVRTLAEEVYAHGHAIGISEADEIGLPVRPAGQLDSMLWDLLGAYERDLKLLEPLDPYASVRAADPYTEPAVLAVVESSSMCHEFSATLLAQGQRTMPPNLQVQVNMPVQLPPGVNPQMLSVEVQKALQAAQQAMPALAHAAVQDALRSQAPLVGCDVRLLDAAWRKTR
jgi:hypothetical protein